jgi:branched-chain amino acid transport system permease protein
MSVGEIAKGVPPADSLVSSVDVLGIKIAPLEMLTAGVTIVALIALTLLMKRTMLGIQLRASTEDFSMARLSGVRANYVITAAFVITGCLAALASLVLVARNGIVAPGIGTEPTLIAFVGAVIGGLGSLPGAAIGGFVLGALTTLLQATLPLELSPYTNAIVFSAVIAILVVRPEGLVRRSSTA